MNIRTVKLFYGRQLCMFQPVRFTFETAHNIREWYNTDYAYVVVKLNFRKYLFGRLFFFNPRIRLINDQV